MSSRLITGAGVESRRAVRRLLRSPGFSLGVVLVLGIAITGMVTVATAAYALFWSPLPFPRAEQLVQVSMHSRTMGFGVGFSPPMLADISEETMAVEVAAWQFPDTLRSAQGEDWRVAGVTHDLPDVLGMQPIAGRAFVPADADPGAPAVGLIGETAWRNRFGADESVIGRELVLNGRRVQVIGVMPASFYVPTSDTEFWQVLRYTPEQLAWSNQVNFAGGAVVARLGAGFNATGLEEALRIRYDPDERSSSHGVRDLFGLEPNVAGLREAWTAGQRRPLAVVGLASFLVLATALFNVAGLWLARLLGRTHEHALQAALGAGEFRRVACTTFEFLLLGAAGACLALALTPQALQALKELGVLEPDQPLAIRTGAATVLITFVVLIASSVPVVAAAAWQQRRQRRELLAGLAGGGRGATGTGARTRRVLIIAQLALAMSLLSAMGLLLRSWYELLNEDLGFEPRELLVTRIEAGAPDAPGGPDPVVAAALEATRGVPGVREVAHTSVAPFSGSAGVTSIRVPSHEGRETTVRSSWVGLRYFETIGLGIRRGRSFEAGDRGVIIDEFFADHYFPDGAVGQYVGLPDGPGRFQDVEILGVAATAKHRALDETPEQGTLYRLNVAPYPSAWVVISTSVRPESAASDVRSALERVLGSNRVGEIVTMKNLVRRTLRDREPQLVLLALFGLETLALAAIGLFSLLAYSVRARTAEFAVRQAVGANASDIRRQVLADALRLLAFGLAIGIAGALVAGLLIADRLYAVSPVDPVTWIGTGVVLVFVVLAAGFWPAERAARIEPTEALRHE